MKTEIGITAFFVVWLLWAAIYLSILGVLVYAIIHFVSKFW